MKIHMKYKKTNMKNVTYYKNSKRNIHNKNDEIKMSVECKKFLIEILQLIVFIYKYV